MTFKGFAPDIIRRAAAALAVAAAVASTALARPTEPAAKAPDASLEILDVGQGDAILVRSPEWKTALIDAGPSHGVVAALRKQGVSSLDLLVLSHHHADHYGGMAEVVKAFHPRVFLATNSSHTTSSYLKLLETVRDANVRAIQPGEAPRKIGLGSLVLTVFPQPPDDPKDENDNSIGIRLDYGDFSALLTGDSQEKARAYWLKECPSLLKDVTILKLAHHGSRNGTDAKWLDVARPEMAVASLGAWNDYGHPHPETLSLLQRKKIPLLRTDLDGTIAIVSDGKTWDVTTSKRGRAAGGPDEFAAGERSHAGSHSPAPDPSRRHAQSRTRDARVQTTSGRIDLNTATEDELIDLPGIGPTLARRITLGRPYRSVDDLTRVRGIGEARAEQLRPLVIVR
ncbi:MAG TPA: helix-hairpin-helix domain-containing protein [Isosphaeraceae bacterium]